MIAAQPIWDNLLDAARSVHQGNDRVSAFCPFPSDLTRQEVSAKHIPSSDLLQAETGLFTDDRHRDLRDAFIAAAPLAWWRETYRGTNIGEDFLNRFGCYGLIGPNAPFASQTMRAWVVYMPAQLHYPWHHHPAAELYFTIAGEAEFLKKGDPGHALTAGGVTVHASDQPHATTTHAHPMMAYVVWRDGFETAPVLTSSRS